MGKKRKSQPNQPKKVESNVLKIEVGPVAMGHQPHITGSGVHQDRRRKRLRTRSAQRRAAVGEY